MTYRRVKNKGKDDAGRREGNSVKVNRWGYGQARCSGVQKINRGSGEPECADAQVTAQAKSANLKNTIWALRSDDNVPASGLCQPHETERDTRRQFWSS